MSQPSVAEQRALLTRPPDERADVDPETVQEALQTVVEHGDRTQKVLEGCSFPDLDFAYADLTGANEYPLVFRNCTFESFRADHADVEFPVHFEACAFGDVTFEDARFEYDAVFDGSTVEGDVCLDETRFDRDASFVDVRFQGATSATEVTFGDDTRFVGASFAGSVDFRAARFSGTSNDLGDNADFSGVTFEADVTFRRATFGATTFDGATFRGVGGFEAADFEGTAVFEDTTFHDEADFDEARFGGDAAFSGTTFERAAVFRGAVFEGGMRSLRDDADFSNVSFREATFDDAAFRDADFTGATVDEVGRFNATRFSGDATFDDVVFATDVDFAESTLATATFDGTQFGGVVDFEGAAFTDEFRFAAEPLDADVCVNFTDASLKHGEIHQPTDAWVRYDLTRASLGAVDLSSADRQDELELLDYFRFLNTEFDEFDGYEFDFSAHTYYLDRNRWNVHDFDEPAGDYEFALPATPANVETTYLKAKKAASSGGYVKAAGEFRVKRQRAARRKHLVIARDAVVDWPTRVGSVSRAVENAFLDVSCGYGMRLGRILTVFLLFPLFPGLLYAFGGDAFRTSAGQLQGLGAVLTPEGARLLYENVYFSYITFLTIGYGGIGPVGALARLTAAVEVYLSVVLGGLVLYALVKRSEL
ncbi:pentapeptide repeat-containing protein [Halospeciosus flavus]|uniref:Pentapeptide repeat-containing protein n=1 Tax=Halospeciosus flavus TaxID=3032283 RepID=A0ABD5Z2D6_9EURY|nr:pentapeptide repeat-containing protein [Halospeciosus flavus]